MRVLFLDFDGVLNSSWDLQDDGRSFSTAELAAAQALIPYVDGPAYLHKVALDLRCINPVAIERLNRIVEQSGAKVVVSSSWRKAYTTEGLQRLLAHLGFVGHVIDRTPQLPRVREGLSSVPASRGSEIAAWIASRLSHVEFVILDDDTDMDELAHRHVKTQLSVGLSEANVRAVLTLFNLREPESETDPLGMKDPTLPGLPPGSFDE